MRHDRTIYETLTKLETRARRGSRIAERVLWETLEASASAGVRDQLPAMYDAWKSKGWTIATVLYKVRFNTWKLEDMPRETTLSSMGDEYDAEHRPEYATVALDGLIGRADLTQDELLIIELYRAGYTQSEIADRLELSQSAVSKQFAVILEKIRENLESAE